MTLLVFLEHHDGAFVKNSLGVLAKAAELGEADGVVAGSGVKELAATAGEFGARKVWVADDPRLEAPLPQPRVDVLEPLVREQGYDAVLFGQSVLAADVAAGLAARLDAGLNWDLFPIALLALATLALARGREPAAGAWTGLGVAAKLFPGVLVLPALGAIAGAPSPWPARVRRALRLGLPLAAAILAVNLPVALLAPEAWAWFFRFNAQRGAENSLWSALHVPAGPLLEALSTGPVLAASAFAAWAAARAARREGGGGRAVRLGAALALVVWIATNKIWSPQYALYGFLAGALAAAPLPLFGVLSAASFLDYWAEFEVRGRRWEPAFRDLVFQPVNAGRTVLWLALALFVGRALWREARGGGGGFRRTYRVVPP